MNEHLIKASLRANNLTIGFHWIYDRKYLKKLSDSENLLGQKPKMEHYAKAELSYYAYNENSKYTLIGEILKWLFEAIRENRDFDESDYKKLLLEKFMPGGSYNGYVESYANKLVFNELSKYYKITPLELDDDQMVGFLPYFVYKWLYSNDNITNYMDRALSLASVLSNNNDYKTYFEMFDYLIENTKYETFDSDLEKAISYAPEKARNNLTKALTIKDEDEFIENYSSTACNIYDAVSLIYFILANAKTYEEQLKLNIRLGGASADRAILLTYLDVFININNETEEV